MKKKALSLLLTVALTASMLVGCGSSAAPAEEKAEAATEVTLLATVPSDSIAGQEKKTPAPSPTLSTDASRFEPMCACLPASLIITLSVWDKTVGARKMRHLVGVTVKAMPPPGNKRFFSALTGREGARL